MHNASDSLRERPRNYPGRFPVVVNRPAVRTRSGGIHRGSRASIIRQARREHPKWGKWGVREMLFGTHKSADTVVIFDMDLGPDDGLS